MNFRSADTVGIGYEANGDIGDNEVVAEVQALPVAFQYLNAWQNDWADGGIRFGDNTSNSTDFLFSVTQFIFEGLKFTPISLSNGVATRTGSDYSVSSLSEIDAINKMYS